MHACQLTFNRDLSIITWLFHRVAFAICNLRQPSRASVEIVLFDMNHKLAYFGDCCFQRTSLIKAIFDNKLKGVRKAWGALEESYTHL